MTTETHSFQTEAQKLLKLMINSLYSNREVFLRELISNAADAIDKLRFESLSDATLLDDAGELGIHVKFDSKCNALTIEDNGIGMSRDELVENLGTIAKSGTEQFFEMLNDDQQEASQLIGQFGVGFYSAFLVADQINVTSRRAGTTEAAKWTSSGEADFTVEDVDDHARGTTIELILKEDAGEFTDEFRLRDIVKQYSDHVDVPVWIVDVAGEDSEPKQINTATALWSRPKNAISDDEYKEFYKSVSHDFQDPLLWAHNKIEGKVDYTSLLFVPAKAPFMFAMTEKTHGLKLYAQRVFITDQLDLFLPDNLNFVKGVVDIRDLPLNMSRESIQENDQIRTVRNAVVKRVVDSLLSHANKDANSYNAFWTEFGHQMKVAYDWDQAYDANYYKLMRFASTQSDGSDQTVGLEEYVERASDGQKEIYYLVGESASSLRNNPLLEHYTDAGIEVLLLSDDFDSYIVERFKDFDDHAFKDISLSDVELPQKPDDDATDQVESTDEDDEVLLQRVKDLLEDESLSDVTASQRLHESASCLVRERPWISRGVRNMLKDTHQILGEEKLKLELNMVHPLVQRLKELEDETKFEDLTRTLLDQARLAYGSLDVDTAVYVRRVNGILAELLENRA
ncbi:MAG: molecular chaperone HtpG [Gammaproteobacteria bacterium]|nr:molecular chaperone HtpG [Gammaproteobacteria bacterium]